MDVRQGEFIAALHSYLKEIRRISLLTREQEISYGKQVQQMMKALEVKNKLAAEFGREPTKQEWANSLGQDPKSLSQILSKGERARQTMVKANLRLVVNISKEYTKRGVELLDLIQEGSIGLQRAAERFDPTLGYKFSTYAYCWIRQAITRAISQQSRTIRVPSHIYDLLCKIKKARADFRQESGRYPSQLKLGETVGVPPEKIRECLQLTRIPISLDRPITGDRESSRLQDIIPDPEASPESTIEAVLTKEKVEKLLRELIPQQQDVINLRFGLYDGTEWSYIKIGKHLSISRQRVRQVESQAIAVLRRLTDMNT